MTEIQAALAKPGNEKHDTPTPKDKEAAGLSAQALSVKPQKLVRWPWRGNFSGGLKPFALTGVSQRALNHNF